MKKVYACIVLMCLSCGCKSEKPQVIPDTLQGKWLFAFMQRADMFSAPPKFDVYTFGPGNKINIESATHTMSFDGAYTLSGDNLTYSFKPKDVPEPVKHSLKCSLIDYGQTLILTHSNNELVYYRPDRFYENDIAGEWVIEADGKSESMRLGTNGNFLLEKSGVVGHYRLWPSRFGKAMSANVFIPDHGGYLLLWVYKLESSGLTLTPISVNGPETTASVTWKKK